MEKLVSMLSNVNISLASAEKIAWIWFWREAISDILFGGILLILMYFIYKLLVKSLTDF